MLFGEARFRDTHSVEVAGDLESGRRFVIATGSRPYRPPELDFDDPRILDSDTVLQMAQTPRRVTIYGAGVIGCEYASIFAARSRISAAFCSVRSTSIPVRSATRLRIARQLFGFSNWVA